MNTLQTLMIMEVLEFLLCAAILVAVVKVPRLRRRVEGGLHVALSYVGSYFRSHQTQTQTVPVPDYRQELVKAAVMGLCSNPAYRNRENIRTDAEEIAEKMLYVAPEPESDPFEEHDEEEEENEFDRDGEPNYGADEEEETEN